MVMWELASGIVVSVVAGLLAYKRRVQRRTEEYQRRVTGGTWEFRKYERCDFGCCKGRKEWVRVGMSEAARLERAVGLSITEWRWTDRRLLSPGVSVQRMCGQTYRILAIEDYRTTPPPSSNPYR